MTNLMIRTEQSPRPTFQTDSQAAHQYDDYVRGSELYQTMVQELLARIHITKDDRVLSLAAGTGLDARAVLDAGAATVFGLDRSLAMATAAKEVNADHKNMHFVQADAAVIPFASAAFDVVLINAAGNYLWDSIYPLLVEVQRVLKLAGTFAFNCQVDELENDHPDDPQRQVRRFAYLQGQMRGYPVRLSAKPSHPFIAQAAQAAGLTLVESTPVQIPTNMDDVLRQLQLPQFYGPFLSGLPADQRSELLMDAVDTLKDRTVRVDQYRSWHFFVFKKQVCLHSA